MNANEATKIVLGPHITEKTSMMVEREATICILVEKTANKREITEAAELLYKKRVIKVNTARTINGKKAFLHLENVEKARDLASNIGML